MHTPPADMGLVIGALGLLRARRHLGLLILGGGALGLVELGGGDEVLHNGAVASKLVGGRGAAGGGLGDDGL